MGNGIGQSILRLDNAPLDSNLASRIEFRSTDGQHIQLRSNTHDTVRNPYGFHIEKTADNTQQTFKAYLSVEGDIVSGGNVTAPTFVGALTGNATSSTTASKLTINSSASASWYNILWNSGTTVYGSTGSKLTVQPSTGSITSSGIITASGGNSSQWNDAYSQYDPL